MIGSWIFEGVFTVEMLQFLVDHPEIKAHGQREVNGLWQSYVQAPDELLHQMKAMQ